MLPSGTGVVCDIGSDGPLIALRADIDALPISDEKDVPYRSTVEGMCHGCGHDAHTAILLGRGRAARRTPPAGADPADVPAGRGDRARRRLRRRCRDGVLDGVEQIFALHCDPRLETGQVGVRVGAITAACDHVEVVLRGAGGHTARPHLTQDVVYALGRMITDLPGLLSRLVDPRAALSLVWGSVEAGRAPNAIPTSGRLRGTLRVFDRDAWDAAGPLVRTLVDQIVAASGVRADHHLHPRRPAGGERAVEAVEVQRAAIVHALGEEALVDTEQSMGGEDFAWYLETVPGALARLGVRRPGGAAFDLHQGTFDIDEDALEVGVRYTVALAHAAIERALKPPTAYI